MRHLLIVAIGFRLAGFLLALSSIAALVDLGDTVRVIRRTPLPDTNAPLDIGTYGLIALLVNTARGAGFALHAFAVIFWVVLVILIAAAVLGLLFAVLLYLTGRGIGHHATWARIVAIMLSAGLALTSCAVMTVMQRNLAPLAALPLGLSLYTLWVLIWRFA
jgi:hypothetical protein